MADSTRLLTFGDQTYDFVPTLWELLATKDNPILSAFLDQAHYVVRAQMIQSLPPAEHKMARTFDLADMLRKYTAGKLSPAFQTALSCITQLGCFTRDFHDIGQTFPRSNDTYVLGICTGSLAAAAVSCSESLSQFLPIAVQTVLIAFRLGLLVTETRDRLECGVENCTQPWSVVVYDVSKQAASAAIKDFCQTTALPKTRQPWITSTSSKTVTFSGSPSILKRLLAQPSLAGLKARHIPIYVPSHSSSIFTTEDVKAILETTQPTTWSAYHTKMPFISSVSGKLAWARDYLSVIELALNQCLLEPIGWDQVETELPKLLAARDVNIIRIHSITSSVDRALSAILSPSIPEVKIEKFGSQATIQSHRPDSNRSKLAIVSMSGRFPEAQSTDSFWDLLYQGLDVCKEVPKRRWDVTTHVDPTGRARNKGATKWGCWLDFAGEFDPKFFSISPKEAPQMDPAQRMALMSTYEAMERGGIVPDTTSSTQRNRIGVFHGVTSNDWMETNTAQNIDTYFITGGNRGFIPGRINFCFEFSGPSYTNDTACSSSLAAIHLACNSLWRGDCDTAVAGGTNMIFTPDGHAGLDKGFFLSRTGNCKTFDDNADGYCRAEGVGTVFIKRLEDALADGDPILATILDTKTNHSAMSDSMTRPLASAQIDNMNAVLSTAGVDPNSVDYIEMHGTGTQVGDAVEMESVLSVFAPNEKFRSNPLYVGSVKANVGHGEGVSGVTSLVKVLLMMQHETIPPHCGIKKGSKINHNYPDLAARKLHIAFEPTPWLRTEKPRRVLINNFSAAGGNTALLLEDAPLRETDPTVIDVRSNHIVTVSGHVGKSLSGNMQLLLSHLRQNPDTSLPRLAYTTTARRWHHLHRVAVTGSSVDEIATKLHTAIDNKDGVNRPKAKPGVAFAFTGQGSQYIGMGKQLYDAYPTFRSDLQRFSQLAQQHGLPRFLEIYTSTTGDVEANQPAVVQLAITCLQMALFNLLTAFGIKASAVVGHSLGEYAALYAAGVLSASDTIYLVGRRAELLQEHCQRGTHAMLATKASKSTLLELIGKRKVEIACVNGPQDTVLSGAVDAINEVQKILSAKGIKATILKLPFAFHSAQVRPILGEFEKQAQGVVFQKPSLAVISPLTADIIADEGIVNLSYLVRHCRETVDMVGALDAAKKKGAINEKTIFIEIGPKPLVCGMIKMSLGQQMIALPTLGEKSDVWPKLNSIFSSLYTGGIDLNWRACHAPFEAAKRVIDLPTYSWDLKDYFIEYEGDWVLHRHKIHCNCADEGKDQFSTSHYCPGQHTFQENVVVPDGMASAPKSILPKKPSKLDSTKEAYPGIATTTTLHRIVEETTEPLGATLIVETDISRKDVNGIAQGHTVDDIPLCTPSFYADIAIQAGKYCMDRIRAGHQGAIDGIVDVSNLVVEKALIPHGQAPQLLRTTLTMSWPPKAAATTRSAKVKFATYTADGKLDTEHATCTVRFTTDAQYQSLQRQIPAFKSAMESLRARDAKGELVHYNTISGYKLMSSMARFHPDYKLLDDLVLDQAVNESVSKMNFTKCRDEGTYAAHPAYLDAITQVAGFAMNAKDDTDVDKEVYVNHGWESLQIYEPLRKNTAYEVHTKMTRDGSGDLVHGDTIVLDGSRVVAFIKGQSLRSVPRKALRAVLQSAMDKGIRQRGGKPSSSPFSKPSVTIQPKPASQPAPATNLKSSAKTIEIAPAVSGKQFSEALKIISEESGIAREELTDDTSFVDMGVDSLSSMVITSRLREDLGMDLDPAFALFVDCPTVASLRSFMGSSTTDSSEGETVSNASAPQAVDEADAIVEAIVWENETKMATSQQTTTALFADGDAAFQAALKIVAEESGVAIEDFTSDTIFSDVGIDSLSSMVISSRFREELDLDLDSAFSLFTDLPSVSALSGFFSPSGLTSSEASSEDSAPGSDDDLAGDSSSNTSESETGGDVPALNLVPYCRPTNSVVLQGMPKLASKILFMLPDGGGSASSYATIPRLRSDVAIVGLNCPYARDPENMNCTHGAMIQCFVNEIQRRQPHGPYHLGGWSSGGAFAYVTAEALVNAGEEVHSLLIIDAPVPQVMEKLPVEFYQHCNGAGLFENQPGGASSAPEPPSYLIPHFMAVVDVMLDYKVAPLQTSRMPKVGIVWAAETVMEENEAPKMKGMHFMIQKRTDFGPDGWDTVCPGAEFDIVRAEGANHFTLMTRSKVRLVSDLIDRVMSS